MSKVEVNTHLPDGSIYIDKENCRIKILDCSSFSEDSVKSLIDFAREHKMGKIIANCRKEDIAPYLFNGFTIEGKIHGFFKGQDARCISYFIDKSRGTSERKEEEDMIVDKCLKVNGDYRPDSHCPYTIRTATTEDIPQMIDIFKAVFKTYPSPVFDKSYLKKVMKEKILFKAAIDDGKIISIASADMDKDNLNAEITDCATYPEYRGRGILSGLIRELENELRDRRFIVLYSLSRAINTGINMALSKQRYRYGGRLINNCNICSGFEDMNIWEKRLC